MLTIYGKATSRAARPLWVLEELGLAYDHVPLDPLKGDTQTPEYLQCNPAGKIPVLVDGDFVLTESVAIAAYLASLQPGSLLPADSKARAKIAQWSSWALSEVEPPATRLVRARREAAATGLPHDAAVVASASDEIATALIVLELHLAQVNDYLVGGVFTLADINAAGAVMAAPMLIDMAAFPQIAAWLARIFARPAWQRVRALP